MTVSDWSDWLPRAVESADPETVAIWYLGCNGFVVKGSSGTTVFIDPYLGTGDPPRTVRMVPSRSTPRTSPSATRFSPRTSTPTTFTGRLKRRSSPTRARLRSTDTGHDVIRRRGVVRDYSVTDDQLHEVTEGDTLEIGDLTVHVEPANDPDAEHSVSTCRTRRRYVLPRRRRPPRRVRVCRRALRH